jgi:putative transposase
LAKKLADERSAEAQAAVELVRLAKDRGLSLTGPDGLLKQLTKTPPHRGTASTVDHAGGQR